MPHRRLFGTDGIRSRAGVAPLDPATVRTIGRALGEELGGLVLIGRDPRESSPWIAGALGDGLRRGGARIEDVGVLPTPAVALLTQQSGGAGGVMISASHNPFEDNGIKVFGPDGRKLDDAAESRIEARVVELGPATPASPAPPDGRESGSWISRYSELLGARFAPGAWLQGARIVVDCANGAMSHVAPSLLRSLGAEVAAINVNPTGRNINADCGAVHPGPMLAAAREFRADLGVAYDGDGDRAIFGSASGRLIDGDAVLLVLARAMKRAGLMTPAVVVGTSMTNVNLELKLEEEGIRTIRVDVGDRHIFREMLSSGAPLGGEPSGHVIFTDFRLSGDGLLTTLKLARTMRDSGATLEQLTSDWEPAPQLLRGVRVREKTPLDSLPDITHKIEEIRRGLDGEGRIVVRYSGTEPLLRIMIESGSDARNELLYNDLMDLIHRTPGLAP